MGVVTLDLCGNSHNIIQLSCSVRFHKGKQWGTKFKNTRCIYMEINFYRYGKISGHCA